MGLLCFWELSGAFAVSPRSVSQKPRPRSQHQARCLDGSPAVYYMSKGSGAGEKKYMIFHEGGGWCSHGLACYRRSNKRLGSSVNDSETMDMSVADHIKFSRNPQQNPLMYDWNHIFVRYCDGGFYAGDRAEPVTVFGKKLYSWGKHITEALFIDIAGLESSTDVVLGGCSAGAMHIYAHLDALKKLVPGNARVVGLADSGFFLDEEWITPRLNGAVYAHEGESLLPPQCLSDYAGRAGMCLLGPVAMKYLQTPIFALQSRFDGARHKNVPACTDDICTQAYITKFAASIASSFEKNKGGYFLDSCQHHCFYAQWQALPARPLDDISGLTPLQAFASWYGGGESQYSQAAVVECAECCNGTLPIQ